MKSAKLFSISIIVILGIYGAIGLYFLPMAGFEGDQTRIGLLPESLFGWTMPQPSVDPALMKQSSWQDADILVIGDSFSVGRVWQTELVRHGLRVHTEHWANIRGLCEDIKPWLHAQGFKGKYIVLETVERNVNSGLAQYVGCKNMDFHFSIDAQLPRTPPPTMIDRKKPDYSGRISIGIQTKLNTYKYEQARSQPNFRLWNTERGSIAAKVLNGCTLFSHPRCQDALFLASDNPQELGSDVISNMQLLEERLAGFNNLWVIVPNKTTAYLDPDRHFWDEAAKKVHSVNVLEMVRQAIAAKQVDVYPGNNQHFSTATYLLMGKSIYQDLMEKSASVD